MLSFILHIPRRFLQGVIRIYQWTLSPDHGVVAYLIRKPVCRFHPTCSEYGYQAIGKHGVIKGVPMAIWRILRCHPWTEGGFDPVP